MPPLLAQGFCTGGDGDLAALAGRRVAVIGYGNLGRSVALNLRDSGIEVTVGSREDAGAGAARSDGFEVVPIAEALEGGGVVWVLVPDEAIPTVLTPEAIAGLAPDTLVCFSSGYVLAYGLVDLRPAPVDVAMIAPRMVGAEVRRLFRNSRPFYGYVSVEQDRSGTAERVLLGLARALGGEAFRGLALTARQEATVDLFVEQTVGPLLGTALMTAFSVGTEAGVPPEALVLELYQSGEMSRTWQAFADEGFFRAVRLHGPTAAFGGFIRTQEIDGAAMRSAFQSTLADIMDGGFCRRFEEERQGGYPTYEIIQAMTAGEDDMSAAEMRVRQWFDLPHPGSAQPADGRVAGPVTPA